MQEPLPSLPLRARPDDPQKVVLEWLEFRANAPSDKITDKSAPQYTMFWSSWLKFLQARTDAEGVSWPAIAWHEATGEDMGRFLRSGIRNRKSNAPVSEISRRRYWRLLDRIYSWALHQRWVNSNPALALEVSERPPMEKPEGAILTPSVWAAALRLVPGEEEGDLVATRNRALLLTLLLLGITPQEARALTVQDVLREPMPHSLAMGPINGLQLDGPGPNQRRRLPTPPALADAIQRWLTVRTDLPSAAGHSVLFCSTQQPHMTADNLLALCKQLLVRASAAAGQPQPRRMGPQILRNTRLVFWLNEGVPAAEVALRAGLKNIKGLYHLREHVNLDLRATLAHGRDDEPLQRTQRRAALAARGLQA